MSDLPALVAALWGEAKVAHVEMCWCSHGTLDFPLDKCERTDGCLDPAYHSQPPTICEFCHALRARLKAALVALVEAYHKADCGDEPWTACLRLACEDERASALKALE